MKQKYSDIANLVIGKWWVVMVIAMLATFALALYMGLGQSIWFDEGYSILLAKQSFADLLATTNVDAHPPLYYMILKLWAGIFGWSELALRSLSALLAAGVVGMAIVLIRTLFSTRIALLAAPLIVIAPFLLRYGYEVRMYALASLIAIVATYVFLIALRKGSPRWTWVAYGLLVALGMYTLYMTLVVWLAHVVWLIIATTPKRRLLRHPALLGYGAAIVVFLPQLPVFVNQTLHSALPGVGTELTLTKLVSVFGVLTVYTPEWQIGGWLSLLLIAAVILFGILFARGIKDKTYRQSLLFLAVLVIVPLVFYAATSLPPRKAIFIERYMAHVAVYFYMLVAVMMVIGFQVRKKIVVVSFAVALGIISVLGLIRLHDTGNLNLERMQLPETRQLRAGIPCDDRTTVVADDPYTYIDSIYYFESCNIVFYSKEDIPFRGGYAPLSNSDKRIDSPESVTSDRLVHLYWDGATPAFTPHAGYKLVDTTTYGKQVVATYER